MYIIPVIDLLDNRVVHARQGRRSQYRPLNSPLCHCSDAFIVMDAFLSLHPFDIFYIADLNAIGGSGNHDLLIARLTEKYPTITFWVDRGYRRNFYAHSQALNFIPVLGSESLQKSDLDGIDPTRDCILSLDFSPTGKLGPEELFSDSSFWPETIILMTLQRVGSNSGPDLKLLADYKYQFPEKTFIAAGGIRDVGDLLQLKHAGIDHALVASALHGGQISATEIASVSGH